MSTPRLSPDRTDEVARRIGRGEVFVFPTDTAYGLGASLDHPEAVRRVFEVKERDTDKSVPVLTTADTALEQTSPPAPVRAAIEHFWPGPLTLVVPVADPSSYPEGTTRAGTIALREPAHAPLTPLLRRVEMITGTSANVAGAPTPGSVDDVQPAVSEAVDFILTGPDVEGEGSTVAEWDDEQNRWLIHREGPISRDRLNETTSHYTAEDETE